MILNVHVSHFFGMDAMMLIFFVYKQHASLTPFVLLWLFYGPGESMLILFTGYLLSSVFNFCSTCLLYIYPSVNGASQPLVITWVNVLLKMWSLYIISCYLSEYVKVITRCLFLYGDVYSWLWYVSVSLKSQDWLFMHLTMILARFC